MTATQTETLGMIRNERALLKKERATLEAAGIDVDKYDAELEALEQRAVEANARQERLKRELKECTVEVEAVFGALYQRGSSLLDSIIGAVGKSTPAGKNFQRVRSRIRMPGDQISESSTVEPVRDAPK